MKLYSNLEFQTKTLNFNVINYKNITCWSTNGKILDNNVPSYLNRLLIKRPVLYYTRYALTSPLFIPQVRCEYKKRSFSYYGPYWYNKLPIQLQTQSSLSVFKKHSRCIISKIQLWNGSSFVCVCVWLLLFFHQIN